MKKTKEEVMRSIIGPVVRFSPLFHKNSKKIWVNVLVSYVFHKSMKNDEDTLVLPQKEILDNTGLEPAILTATLKQISKMDMGIESARMSINNIPHVKFTFYPKEMSSFFDSLYEEDTEISKDDKSFYGKCAYHLSRCLQEADKLKSNKKTAAWKEHFKLLNKTDKIPKKRIQKVLIWYGKCLREGLPLYTPEAYSGGTFRDKFIRIENSMKRVLKEPEPKKSIELSEKQKKFLSTYQVILDDCSYNEDQLPVFVKKMCEWWKRVHSELKDSPDYSCYEDTIMSKMVLVDGYGIWMSDEVRRWPEWSGDMTSFMPGNKNFLRFLKHSLSMYNLTPSKSVLEIFSKP